MDEVTKPEPTPAPAPVESPKSTSRIPFYAACAVALALCIVLYSYVTKFKETKITLDQKIQESTKTEESYKELKEEYTNYKRLAESKTSWIKRPYIYKGKLVTDAKGNPVYTVAYLKDIHSSLEGGSSVIDELSKTVTITQAVTVTTHEVKDVQSGVKINGMAYVAVPGDAMFGDLKRVGVGYDHNFIFGTVLGLGLGTTDIRNIDPFKAAYFDLHLGVGTP